MAEITIIPAKNHADEIVRTAAYARVSSDSEDQLNSFAAQIRYYTELLQNSTDAVFVDMYADQGITGTSAAKRTEFQRLMSDCRKGKIDRILTKSISRFARNTKDSLEAVRELKTLGISVYFEKENIDTGEISSEMMLAIYSQFAQEESMSISRNVRMGFQKRMADGSYVPSAVPFGYIRENGKFVIDKEKAEIVRGIFSDYLNGVSAEWLAEKYRVKLATVKYVLTNEKYTGDSIFHKWYTTDTLPFDCRENRGERDKYYVSETHPALISREVFQSVQRLIERKGRAHKGKTTQSYPLRKKIYCGECGTLYKRKERGSRVCWVCRNHDSSADKCSAKQIDEREIYGAFIVMFNKLLQNYKVILVPLQRQIQELFNLKMRENAQIVQLRKELAESREQAYLIAGLRSKGILDAAYYTEKAAALEKNIDSLQKRLDAFEEDDENGRILGKFRKLIGIFERAETITEFDEIKFGQIVEKITVLSESKIRFELIGGIGFVEQIMR